jgi:hypothetical protein
MWGCDVSIFSPEGELVRSENGAIMQASAWSTTGDGLLIRLAANCLTVASEGLEDFVGVVTSLQLEFRIAANAAQGVHLTDSNTQIRSKVAKAGLECSTVEGIDVEGFLTGEFEGEEFAGTFEVSSSLICKMGGQSYNLGRWAFSSGWLHAREAPSGAFPPLPTNPWWDF